jgi:hypothetical protein
MRFPVKTHIQGNVTFLIDAESQELANERMNNVDQIEFGADVCWDGKSMLCIENIESSDLEISVIR